MLEHNCNILNWNVRGLNNPARRKVVKDLVQETRSTIVSIQETKLQDITPELVVEILGQQFVQNFAFLPADGTRGDILLATHDEHYRILQAEVGVHTVTATVAAISGGEQWSLTTVYGPQEDQAKIQFLGELRWISYAVLDKWLIIGDFNMILHAADKSNNNLDRRLMGMFRDLVHDLRLKELNLRGSKFTWTNDRTHTRIDRAFCTTEWNLMKPNVLLQALSSRVSDHCPLFLVGHATVQKHRGFCFEAFWPRLQGFQDVVSTSWQKDVRISNPFLRLHIKLERTSKVLKKWSKSFLGNNRLLMCAARMLIQILVVVQEFRQLSALELNLKRDLKVRFLGMTAVEKLRAKQSAHLSAVQAAEAGFKLFYLQANARRRKNFIQSLKVGAQNFYSHEEKAAAVYNHFSQHFATPPTRAVTLNWRRWVYNAIVSLTLKLNLQRKK